MNKTLIVSAVLVIVAGAGGFFGGMKYQESKINTRMAAFGGRMLFNSNGNASGNGARQIQRNQNFRPVNGEIVASDDKSITVKMQDGSSRIVLISDSTALLKSSEGNKEDLKTGETVMVVGTENPDGSVTAQNIQINPPLRGQNQGQVPTPSQ
ncbi:MAG: DUF5666 domain-containing protein [Patescibacteria group bacterium]|jgi:hypothetical protein